MKEDTPYIINIRKACSRICFNYKKDTNRKNILVLLTAVLLRKKMKETHLRGKLGNHHAPHIFSC